jgi:outer membrane protein assembly factor BamB
VYTLLLTFSILAAGDSSAHSWPGFRGDGSGVTQAVNLPIHWSPDKGIAWKADIPGYGQSSPVIWKNKVFVTSIDGPNQERCFVHAFDLGDGKKIWSRAFAATQTLKNYFRSSRAAPTCVVDEHGVYAFFAQGELIGLTHDGDLLWMRSLVKDYGEFKSYFGLGSSLAQTETAILALVDHDAPSYLVAVDKRTGENQWMAKRGVRSSSWSSPVVAYPNGKPIVILSSSDTVEAHDGETGKLLWKLDGLVGNRIPSANVLGDFVFVGAQVSAHVPMDPKEVSKSNCCLRLTDVDGKPAYERAWRAKKAMSYYTTPLAHEGCVYYVNQVGILHCLDQKTGELLYAERIGGPCWASPLAAGDFVYFFLKKGIVLVIKTGPRYEQVAANSLWKDIDEPEPDPPAVSPSRPAPRPPKPAGAGESAGGDRPAGGSPRGPDMPFDFDSMDDATKNRIWSYFDPVIYGAAAVDGSLVIRTGQELFCVRREIE